MCTILILTNQETCIHWLEEFLSTVYCSHLETVLILVEDLMNEIVVELLKWISIRMAQRIRNNENVS
jgi:hypothetical protein